MDYVSEGIYWSEEAERLWRRLRELLGRPRLQDTGWKMDVVNLADRLDRLYNEVLYYKGVPPEAQNVHRIYKEIAIHMHNALDSLCKGVAQNDHELMLNTQEMSAASRLTEPLNIEMGKLTQIAKAQDWRLQTH